MMKSERETISEHELQQVQASLVNPKKIQKSTHFDGELWDDMNAADISHAPIVEIDAEILYSVPWFGFKVGDIRLRKLHPSLPYILLTDVTQPNE